MRGKGERAALLLGVLTLGLSAVGAIPPKVHYPSPIEIAVSSDGTRLWVVCEGTDELLALDARSGAILRRVPVGRVPKSVAISPDAKRLYVVNSWSDTVSEIDAATLEVLRTLRAGFEPTSAVLDREQRTLYVANRISNDISVIDLVSGVETKRLLSDGAPVIWPCHLTEAASTVRTSTPNQARFVRSRNLKSRS